MKTMRRARTHHSREVSVPVTAAEKKVAAEIREYYRRKKEALEKGLPLPEPPGRRSPLETGQNQAAPSQ